MSIEMVKGLLDKIKDDPAWWLVLGLGYALLVLWSALKVCQAEKNVLAHRAIDIAETLPNRRRG